MNWLKIAGIALTVFGIILVVAWFALPSTYTSVGGFSPPPVGILVLGFVTIPIGVCLFYLGYGKKKEV